jgi:hypothetical protein
MPLKKTNDPQSFAFQPLNFLHFTQAVVIQRQGNVPMHGSRQDRVLGY